MMAKDRQISCSNPLDVRLTESRSIRPQQHSHEQGSLGSNLLHEFIVDVTHAGAANVHHLP